jgi:D-glycero-alpha-D-manno-heptose-7-phosphate kinase
LCGKISGAGGGGFLLLYVEEKHAQLRTALHEAGLREMRYRFDSEGTKVLVNLADGSI